MIHYRTAEIIVVAVLVVHHYTAAGTQIIASVGSDRTVLHIVRQRLAGEKCLDTVLIGLFVIGVDLFRPQIAHVVHIFRGQTEMLHSIFRPPGIIMLHIADKDVHTVGNDRQSLEKSVKEHTSLGRYGNEHIILIAAAVRFPG